MRESVSVVIPTLNAEGEIDFLLTLLEGQTVRPIEILILDSMSNDRTVEIASNHSLVRIVDVQRDSFDHGSTRNMGYEMTVGDYILFMTQDAVPFDSLLIESLIRPFEDDFVAMVSARQIAKKDARPFERHVRSFNYPDVSYTRREADVASLGLKAYFASDVCCAYRRGALEVIGGIPSPCNTNEDMLAAARMIRSGMTVCYEADARVLHSHNLTFIQQLKRNEAIGYFLAKHQDELAVGSETGEGLKLVRYVSGRLIEERDFKELICFGLDCFARLLGNRIGREKGSFSRDN